VFYMLIVGFSFAIARHSQSRQHTLSLRPRNISSNLFILSELMVGEELNQLMTRD
jgi:hypothetical protein